MKNTRFIPIAASFLLGIVLCVCGFFLAGGGHGTYIPLGLCAAPTLLMILPFRGSDAAFVVGLALTPFYWALLAFFGVQPRPRHRLLLAVLLCGQYIGGPLLYWWSGEAASTFPKVIRSMPVTAGVFGVLYAAAHVVLWRSVAKTRHTGMGSRERTRTSRGDQLTAHE